MNVQHCQMKNQGTRKPCGRLGRVWIRWSYPNYQGTPTTVTRAACDRCAVGDGREIIGEIDQPMLKVVA